MIKTILAVIGAAYLAMTIVGAVMLLFRTNKRHNEGKRNLETDTKV